ncbi:hypothetical protein niasHT_035061 [Heterodera trifolii]|uniref:Effector protein n=1 Tax=Heterodera trifolii TaxID=157864 RepID=A0ABD2IR64_9BILA
MFSTVSIATLFLINVYNFYSITADGQANIGNISAKDLTSDGQTPRSAQIPSEIGMETNSTIENKTPKDLTSDGQTPRSAQIPSEIGMETNSTIDKKTPRFDEMPKDLAIDGKLVQSKVKTKKNLAIDNKTPRFDEMPKDLAIDGKLVQSKVKAKNNLTSGNKLPNNEEKQTNLTSDDKMLRSGKRTSKNEKNLENGNNLPNNDDKMQNDGTELLDEFKALLKSDEYKTEGANILINWLLEKECKIHEMNKESDKLEVNDGKNTVGLEKSYEIYSKICAENGDKKAILANYREQLTQMKDTLITKILVQMKEFEEILQKNGPNSNQYMALLNFGNAFKAFMNEMPQMESKSAIIALLPSNSSSTILPSDLIQLVLSANKRKRHEKNH